MMRRPAQGFTLIELLVVIAIIAILAAILFPVFVNAKAHAQTTRCIDNLKQLSLAFQQYTMDFGRMPAAGWGGLPNWCGCLGDGQWVYPERGQIWKYTKNKDIYLCPSDKGRSPKYVSTAPEGLTPKDYPLSYSLNTDLEKLNPDAVSAKLASRLLLLIHEWRRNINDGIFVPNPRYERDLPDNVHYSGTTVSYVDGHARWASKEALVAERDAGYWQVK